MINNRHPEYTDYNTKPALSALQGKTCAYRKRAFRKIKSISINSLQNP